MEMKIAIPLLQNYFLEISLQLPLVPFAQQDLPLATDPAIARRTL